MTLAVEVVPYGREASLALRDHIAAAQADDPLSPVTVIVPSGYVGLSMRRLLASGDLGPAPAHDRTGIANVTFTTLPRLAEQLGGPTLAAAGRRPLSAALLGAAVRAALADDPGVFETVRRHPSTEASISRLWHELRGTDPPTLQRLADGSERGADLVRLLGAVTEHLTDRYDEHDLFAAAEPAIAALGTAEPPTAVIVFLPGPLRAHQRSLLTTLGGQTDTTVLLGATGDPDADTPAEELAAQLGATATFPTAPTAAAGATRVISAPSADVEVHDALRTVMARHRDGTPLDRIAVVYGTAEPYARLLHEQLELNDIPFNGPGVRSLSHTTVGRTILGALELPDRDWRRNDIVDWLSAAPIRHRGRQVPTVAWDRLTRAAGVTRGLDSWKTRLDHHRAMQEAELDDARTDDDISEARLAYVEREIDDATRIVEFVGWLTAEITTPRATWADWTRWARRFIAGSLGGPAQRDGWPSDEEQALEEVDHALDRLGALDEVEAGPDRTTFRRALESELATTVPQTTRFGSGVLVGPIRTLVGLDLDLVVVLGMADGSFPARVADDNLLPDRERAAAGGDLPLRAEHAAETHRTYLAALAAATERILSHPRGDLRSGREQRPSRWWLDGLAEATAADRTLYSRDVGELPTSDGHRSLPSATAAIRAGGEPTGPGDHDLRLLLRHHDQGERPSDHWLAATDPVLAAGLELRAGRRSRDYTRYDGDTGPRSMTSEGQPSFSPTALETYATCPRRYLLGRILHIEAPDKPERVVRISPLDRGSLVHKVLERFLEAQTDRAAADRIDPGQRWTHDDHALLDTLFDQVAADYVGTGRTGLRLLWQIDERSIRRDLHSLLDTDNEHRAEHGATPESVELPFGYPDSTPVELTLADGRVVGFHGYIDRLDHTTAGGAVVRDYKSSKTDRYEAIADDPVDRGRHLQPAIYGLAARSYLGDVDAPVDTGYWFTREAAGFGTISIDLDDAALERFRGVVAILLGGVEGGHFPANPGESGRNSNCTYCDFAPVCPSTRYTEWGHVAEAKPLHAYVDLIEGDLIEASLEPQGDQEGAGS